MASVYPHALVSAEPATLKGRRFGNIVLAGSAAPLPVTAYADRAARGAYPYRVLHGARMTQLIGGQTAFTDADGEPSPLPDHQLRL